MVSILMLTRDAPMLARDCLSSLLSTTSLLGGQTAFELVLIDDHSDPAHGIIEQFQRLRRATPLPMKIIRFKSHQHYAHGLAYGFAAARGSAVLFVSHDMILAPACVRTLLELAAVDPACGIIRPRSRHMDYAERTTLDAPFPIRDMAAVNRFSKLVRQRFGLDRTPWDILIGDAMLVQRRVIDAIGVPDMRFFGFMADIDYGIRAQRAGFLLPIAHGAWLHHPGQGHVREAARDAAGQEAIRIKNVADADTAWRVFRAKWGTAGLPDDYRELREPALRQLVLRGPADGSGDYHAPPALDPKVCEFC